MSRRLENLYYFPEQLQVYNVAMDGEMVASTVTSLYCGCCIIFSHLEWELTAGCGVGDDVRPTFQP